MKTLSLLSALVLISYNSDEKETSNEDQPAAPPKTNEPAEIAQAPELVNYSGIPEGESSSTKFERKLSAPSTSMAKVIAANSNSPTAIPRPTPQPRVPSTTQEEPAPPKYKTAKAVSPENLGGYSPPGPTKSSMSAESRKARSFGTQKTPTPITNSEFQNNNISNNPPHTNS